MAGMRFFTTFAQLAEEMGQVGAHVELATVRSARDSAGLLVEKAKAAIGTYEYGWTPLSSSTLAKKGSDTPLLERGDLRDSYKKVVKGKEAWVGSDDRRARWFEDGTSRMPPRPVLGPTLQRNKGKVRAVFEGEVRKAL